MIDFEANSIRSLCHPARFYSEKLSSRLEEAVLEVAEEKAQEADEEIRDGNYDRAAELLGEMIERLEELEDDVESDSEDAHRLTYVEVDNKAYHGRIVEVAGEYGEDECTLGALKAAKEDLETSAV